MECFAPIVVVVATRSRKGQLMTLNRRLLLQSIPVGIASGALSLPARSVLGQSRERTSVATPTGSSAGSRSLENALLAIEPDRLLSKLMTSTVTTTLFPSDTGTVEVLEWVDNSDTDLFGSVGGVLMQTSTDQNNNFIGPGVYIILRNVDDATERRETMETSALNRSSTTSITIGGFPGVTTAEPNDVADQSMESSAVTLLQVAYLVIAGAANGPADGSTEFRSVSNAVGLLDHLRTVVQAPA